MLPLAIFCIVAGFATQAPCQATDDIDRAVSLVNHERGREDVQPLLWSYVLADYARAWVDKIASGQVGFEHATGADRSSQGENLWEETASFCDMVSVTPVLQAMKYWLNQSSLYDNQPVTGHERWLHWSQCMWRESSEMGCAVAYNKTGPCKVYTVCRFYPQGNTIGQKPF